GNEVELPSEGPSEPSVESDVLAEIAFEETAAAIISEMTPRQLDVLRRTDDDETIDEMAKALSCSVGTIVNEQKRVGALISRFSETDSDKIALLKIVRDRAYRSHETDD
ncbi:MAG: hypothetical protein ACREMY_03610, partial [bacterium]